ncbi:MAG: helix-turn-helix domain-containing protein [Lachnospiraceae bacterium]|nr:helix-turn-helix domain-containing protein [Lachnospiraceae bacterium]
MELGSRIKQHRNELKLSQEELAEMVYVTRQTISNWENDKNYPDINSLLRLSEIFHVSADVLLKGDIEVMQQVIKEEDIRQFGKMGNLYAVLLLGTIITPIPLVKFLGWAGAGIWGVLMIITLVYAFLLEKKKKELDISTYKEIAAFMEGKRLDEIETAREEGKRPYQRFLLAIAAGLIALIICGVIAFLLK